MARASRADDAMAAVGMTGPPAGGPPPQPDGIPPQLWDSVGFLLSKSADIVEADFATSLHPYHLTPREYGVLASIAEQGAQSQQQLGTRLGIDRTTMVTIIDDLEGREVVLRVRDRTDRRRYEIVLTEAGRQLITKDLPPVHRRAHDTFLAPLTDDERRLMLDMLRRLIAANA